MFYRRKIILALMQLFDDQLEKIRLQKLLFLFTQSGSTDLNKNGLRIGGACYDFVPYKYGCFSYSAYADLGAMTKRGMVNESETHFTRNDQTDYFTQLKTEDKKVLLAVKNNYGKMSADALMKHTYVNFPFYAINSVKAPTLLTKSEYQKVIEAKPNGTKTVLFTIGYEGISLEEYLVRLLKNDVKVLIDVRNNPLSMKYGFSKTLLKRNCESLGIQYLHFPEVGIQSEQRKELTSQTDYDELFSSYRRNNLSKTVNTQTEILNLLKQHKRIALTCFEANICQCHRKHLAEAIEALPSFSFEVKHI